MSYREADYFLDLGFPFAMELIKFLLSLKNLVQELLATKASADLLPVALLLFKALDRTCFFLRGGEDTRSLVEVSVDKLVLVETVASRLGQYLVVKLLICEVVCENLLSQRLLQGPDLNHLLQKTGLVAYGVRSKLVD